MTINDTQLHCHTQGSNLRMRDCIIKPKALIDHAYEFGMKAVAITDHASLSEHITAMKYSKELKEQGKDIKVLLGDEIYVVDDVDETRENYQGGVTKFYHFLLIAKDRAGYDQLLRINDEGWKSSFMTGKMRRVPNDKKQLEAIISDNKGHLIMTTACVGGELAQMYLNGEIDKAKAFVEWCIDLFTPECFAIEIQPSDSSEQVSFNKWAWELSKEYGVRCVATCDVHYLVPEHHDIHAAFLRSSEADRGETEDFYQTTWMMNYEQKRAYFPYFSDDEFDEIVNNGWDLVKDVEFIDMEHQTIIPERDLSHENYSVAHIFKPWYDKYTYINKFAHSEYEQDRYFLSMVEQGFLAKKQEFNDENMARIDWEMEQLWVISDNLGARMSAYYNLVDHIVDICWEIGFVGISRGSVTGYYTAWLIDMQQMNPIQWNLPAYRHLNAQRISWPDVDLDTSARNRPKIIQRLKEEFGEDNILNICTFKTESPKAALKTVCRGLGISSEEGGYLSSLVPVERGKQWSLHDCYEGNENEDRKPIYELANEVKKLSDEYGIDFKAYTLLIEGLTSGLSLHASGIYIFKDGYIKQNSLMKTPRGDSVTCWSMEDSDYTGGLKYDSLTTECQDKLEVCTELLLKYGKIKDQGSIRSTYNRYLHPLKLDYDNQEMWDACCKGKIIDLFQFITPQGSKCIAKIQPHNIIEMTNANSLMRIVAEGDAQQPVDKFLAYKQNRQLWYDELKQYGVNRPNEIEALKAVLDYCYGAPSMQEDVMELMMRPEISNFTLADADLARKIIAKKKKDKVAGLHDKFYKAVEDNGNSINVANYVWEECIKPQLSYSFSRNHVMPYSAEALQEMNLYYFYNPAYWNCATLTVNAGMADEDSMKNIQYDKLAKGIYRSINFGVPVLPPSINDSETVFTPREVDNSILFGLGAISGINNDIAQQAIANRPYSSFKDFYDKNVYSGSLITESKVVSLIKAGCFDQFAPRIKTMKQYILYSHTPKSALTLANLQEAQRIGCKFPKAIIAPINFKRYVCSKEFLWGNHPSLKSKKIYRLDDRALRYFNANCKNSLSEGIDWWEEDSYTLVVDKSLEKLLKSSTESLKEYMNTPEFIDEFNRKSMKVRYEELVPNQNVNRWSMEATSFYHNGHHELENLDFARYNIDRFMDLPEEPQFIEKSWGSRTWKQYELSAICGTIISKDDNNHYFMLLTPDNEVVGVRMTATAYAHYKSQISVIDADGKKAVVEKPWISRGNLIVVSGYRTSDMFVAKKYKNSIYQHQIMKIENVYDDGSVDIVGERYGSDEEND